jgi:hypothetical protein
VVKTFESRYNLVLIRLVKFLESEEWVDSSWDDKTAFPPNNPPSFVVTTTLTVHVGLELPRSRKLVVLLILPTSNLMKVDIFSSYAQ